MRRYVNYYRNQPYLYSVFRAEEGEDYILVAVVPGVGWWEAPKYQSRRIEGQIRNVDRDHIVWLDEIDKKQEP